MPDQPYCAKHSELSLQVHDLEGSDKRQWKAIEELMDSVELVQQASQNLAHRIDLHIAEDVARLKDIVKNGNGSHKDTVGSRLTDIFWKVIEYGILVGIATFFVLWAQHRG